MRALILCLLFGISLGRLDALPTLETGGPSVAVLSVAEDWPEDPSLLFISVFNDFFAPGQGLPNNAVYVVPEFESKVRGDAPFTFDLVTEEVGWGNQVQYLAPGSPEIDLPFPAIVGVSGRFPTAPRFAVPSVPGKVFILNATELPASVVQLSEDEPSCADCDGCANCGCEWYYQQFIFYDVDEDGDEDILSVRTRDQMCNPLPIFPPFTFLSEFVAFLQPEDPVEGEWELLVLHDFDQVVDRGSLGFFSFVDLDAELAADDEGSASIHPTPELVYGEFNGLSVNVYSVGLGETWVSEGKSVFRSVVDDTLGQMYSAQVVDVNRDGKGDIVATTHTTREDNGIYAYDVLGDFRSEPHLDVVRYPLATNFSVVGREPSQFRIRPSDFVVAVQRNNKKPELVIGTDGGGQAVQLKAKNNSPNSWEYESTALAELGCDFLTPIAYDLDGDRKSEVSISCLGEGRIYSWESTKKNMDDEDDE